ncbi:MAG: hypothetical protein ACO2PP_04225 [Thermocrinis sp.]|jgi:hypothetical protein|uniref:hypothetical protein n=1 Tax=Thermocrinis sp. TaxID=2024383 RepID=UPI003C0B7DA7
MGRVRSKDPLSEIALILGMEKEVLITKLLTVNALLLEKAKREGVDPKEFFEGCLYVPKEVREKLGEGWEEELKKFLKEVQSASIEDPIEEARYWIRKLSIESQTQQNGLREMTIFVEGKLLDEFVKVGNEALVLGLVKKGYDEEVGRNIASLVRNYLQREIKLLKDKILRRKVRGR